MAFLERALTEAKLREEAMQILNLTSARPRPDTAAKAIQAVGTSHQKLNGRILTPVQSNLPAVINNIREIGCFQGHSSYVRSVAFSPDDQRIVSGSDDQTIRLWDLQGTPIGEPFQGHSASVLSVAFSPVRGAALSGLGQRIVSGSDDQTIRLWGGSWLSWLALCCDRFRYHPIFTDPPDEVAREACEVCERLVWNVESEEVEGGRGEG